LAQQIEPFGCKLCDKESHSSNISAWSVQALNEAQLHWIQCGADENDGNGGCRTLRLQRRTVVGGDYYRYLLAHKIGQNFAKLTKLGTASVFNDHVLTFHISGFSQTSYEGIEAVLDVCSESQDPND